MTVSLDGDSWDYTFGPDTVGLSAAEQKPFLLTVAPGDTQVSVAFEDLAGRPGCDYDYNDRTWAAVSVAENAEDQGLIAAGSVLLSPNELGETGKVYWSVRWAGYCTQYDTDQWLWRYVLANQNMPADDRPPGGVGGFAVLTNVAGPPLLWGAKASLSGWRPESAGMPKFYDYNGPVLGPGGTGRFEFYTPPVPIVDTPVTVPFAASSGGLNPGGMAKGPGVPPTVSIQVDKLIPVNANTDNFKPNVVNGAVTNESDRWLSSGQKFIPKVRDFTVAGAIWKDDPQLKPVTLQITPGVPGTLKAWVEDSGAVGGGKAKLWNQRDKGGGQFVSIALPQRVNGQDVWSKVVYIEGTYESFYEDELKVKAEYNFGAGVAKAVDQKTAVTPILTKVSASRPSDSVFFVEVDPANGQKSGLRGLATGDGGMGTQPGIQFSATAVTGGHYGAFKYLQNVKDIVNGLAAGDDKGYVYTNRVSQSTIIRPGSGASFWLLDTPAGQVPFYPTTSVVTGDPGQTIEARDSPEMGSTPDFRFLTRIDQLNLFRMHVVVQFADDQSLYSIAHLDWDVRYYAYGFLPGYGVTTLDPASKVTMSGPWERNNPGTTDPRKTVGPVGNAVIEKLPE